MKHKISLGWFILLHFFLLFGQTARGQVTYFWVGGTGTGTMNTLTNWNTVLGGGGTSPAGFSAANVFVIDGDNLGSGATGPLTLEMNASLSVGQLIIRDNAQSVRLTGLTASTLTVGGTVTGSDWVLSAGCSLILSVNSHLRLATVSGLTGSIGGTVTIEAGQSLNVTAGTSSVCTVTGTLLNSGTVVCANSGRLVFGNGGVYEHAQNGGVMLSSLAAPFATFNTGSTCRVSGVTDADPVNNQGVYFHYIWNCPGQTTAAGAISGNVTINGNLTIGNNSASKMQIDGVNTIAVNGKTILGGDMGGEFTITGNGTLIRFGNNVVGDSLIIGTAAYWRNSSNAAVRIYNMINRGTFMPGTGVQSMYGIINSSSQLVIANLKVEQFASLTNFISVDSGLTITGSLTGLGGFVQGAYAKLHFFPDSIAVRSFSPNGSGNQVIYCGSNQNVRYGTYHHLISVGSGEKTWVNGYPSFMVNGDFTVGDGVTFNMAGNSNTTINGNTFIGNGGTLNFNLGSTGLRNFKGNITISENGIWNNSANLLVKLFLDTNQPRTFTNDGTFISGSVSYLFYGVSSLQGNSPMTFNKIFLYLSSPTDSTRVYNHLPETHPLTLSEIVSSSDSAAKFIQGPGAYLNITGLSSSSASFVGSAQGNTVNYTGGTQNVMYGSYYHLILSGQGTRIANSPFTVMGDFTLKDSTYLSMKGCTVYGNTLIENNTTFFVGGAPCSFRGHFTNYGFYDANTYLTKFDGSGTQNIRCGNISLRDVIFDNPSNSPHSFILEDDMPIRGSVTLNAGRIMLGNYNCTLESSASVTGSPSSSAMFVADGNGMLKKEWGLTGSSFTFPVGDATGMIEYSPVTLGCSAIGSPVIGVRVVDAAHPYVDSPNHLSRYWVFSGVGATLTGLSFPFPGLNYQQADVLGEESRLRPAAWNGNDWIPLSGGSVNPGANRLATSLTSPISIDGLEVTGKKCSFRYVWVGTDGDWQIPSNWTPTRILPAREDTLVIGNTAGAFTINNVPHQFIASLIVYPDVRATLVPSLSTNVLTVSDSLEGIPDLLISPTGGLTVGTGLTLNINTYSSVSGGLNILGDLSVNGRLRLGGTLSYSGNAPFWGNSSRLLYDPALGIAGGNHFITMGNEAGNSPNEVRILLPVNTDPTYMQFTLGVDLTTNILDLRYKTDGTICTSGCSGYANHALTIILNGRTLRINSNLRNYGFSTHQFRGSPNSSLILGGIGSLSSPLYFDQAEPGITNALAEFTINRLGTGNVLLGNSLFIYSALNLTNGRLDLVQNSLSLACHSITRTTAGILDADMGTVLFRNSVPLTLPSGLFSGNVNNLTVDSGGGVTHGSPTTVSGNFTLMNGNFSLGAHDLNLGTAVLSGGSAAGYVKTTGIGRLRRIVSSTDALFPVGRAYYNPVIIRNLTGTDDLFSLRVDDAVYLNGQNGAQITEKRINATWFIDKVTPNSLAGTGVDFTFYWNEVQKLPGITEFTLNHHDGTGWKIPISTGTPSYTSTQLSFPGYKGTFSPFAIGQGSSPLPVVLRSFKAACSEGRVELEWITESEINNNLFTVFRSSDLKAWEEVLTLPGAGNSNALLTYTAYDERPYEGISYYRLKQTDYDGTSENSYPISNFCRDSNTGADWIVYPNPTEGVFILLLAGHPEKGELRVELTDLGGRVLKVFSIPQSKGSTYYTADMSEMPAGIYLLRKYVKGAIVGNPLKIILR